MEENTYHPSALQKISGVKLGPGVTICDFVNLYECSIGASTKIGPFVEIQRNATVGDRCKISSHTLICEGVTIEDEVFIGHGVVFVNDPQPKACRSSGALSTKVDRQIHPGRVKRGASIGSGAVIMCDVTVGERSVIGAGAVVTKDVPAGVVVVGNPAQILRELNKSFEE